MERKERFVTIELAGRPVKRIEAGESIQYGEPARKFLPDSQELQVAEQLLAKRKVITAVKIVCGETILPTRAELTASWLDKTMIDVKEALAAEAEFNARIAGWVAKGESIAQLMLGYAEKAAVARHMTKKAREIFTDDLTVLESANQLFLRLQSAKMSLEQDAHYLMRSSGQSALGVVDKDGERRAVSDLMQLVIWALARWESASAAADLLAKKFGDE